MKREHYTEGTEWPYPRRRTVCRFSGAFPRSATVEDLRGDDGQVRCQTGI
jgi:hypothetical protein